MLEIGFTSVDSVAISFVSGLGRSIRHGHDLSGNSDGFPALAVIDYRQRALQGVAQAVDGFEFLTGHAATAFQLVNLAFQGVA